MEEKRKIVPFLVILIVTQVSIVIGGLVGAIKGCGLFLVAFTPILVLNYL